MIFVRETEPDVFEQITGDLIVGEGDTAILHPLANFNLYSYDELAAIGVIPVEHARLPMDQYEISRSFHRVRGRVVEIIESAPSATRVPPSVSKAQARIALKRAGLLSAVNAAITADPESEAALWYSDATTWERNNVYVAQMAAALGLSDEQVDGLFIEAATVLT